MDTDFFDLDHRPTLSVSQGELHKACIMGSRSRNQFWGQHKAATSGYVDYGVWAVRLGKADALKFVGMECRGTPLDVPLHPQDQRD